ncbi:MAG: rRNA ((1498)-N(3))-methyltransferase [Nevskia sp.]|nr:rRNA ((1498)-N(3))-methyltransferase [Nevskia sp.]
MTRIYVEQGLALGAELNLPEAAAHHLVQVLRVRVGEMLTLFDGRGGEYAAEIVACERRRVGVRVQRRIDIDRESKLRLTLAQCVSKGERMDYTLQKAVELGVSALVPLLSSRSVVKLDAERWEKKLEHWRGVIVSACEQSGRTRVPTLAQVEKLESWAAAGAAHSGLRLVLAPGASTTLKSLSPAQHITLLAGPEGGLSEDEIALVVRHGFTALSLGPRVLRTETAGVAALAALQALSGDLG